jgi:hypothetical protein
MPLARFDAPFEHPDWIFEPTLDGFRAVAYVEGGACRLVSRNRNVFEPLAQAITQEFSGRSVILDGEIAQPGPDGRLASLDPYETAAAGPIVSSTGKPCRPCTESRIDTFKPRDQFGVGHFARCPRCGPEKVCPALIQ